MKALILFSGGLDSRLVLRMMKDQLGEKNIESIFFLLPFGSGCCNEHCALNFSQKELTKLTVVDCTKGQLLQEYVQLIRKPKHNRGTAMNPCKDCKIFILKKAKEYADKHNIELIVTGEVLNERPMSQTKKSLDLIEEQTDLKGRLLRPLSAKLLEPTNAEKEGRIDREKFLDITGRRRTTQMDLAKKYKISYPSPGGGCLLCEKEFCKKLSSELLKSLKESHSSIFGVCGKMCSIETLSFSFFTNKSQSIFLFPLFLYCSNSYSYKKYLIPFQA